MIVESPGKVKKIQSILGEGWRVQASVGHVRDLPSDSLAIDIDNGFRPQYQLTDRGKTVISQLRKLANNATDVFLATDLDREGEAIAWHLKVSLGLQQYKRIAFTEITKSAIHNAVKSPRQLNMALVSAQEARRVIDRLVGYRVSPVIGNIFSRRGLSAGRVQTPALGLVTQRELAIRGFVVTDYYDVYLSFAGDTAWVSKWNPKSLLTHPQQHWTDKSFAQKVAQLRELTVVNFTASVDKRRPPSPFITSTLQQAASVALKITPADTMKLAQGLYEAGLITYMRTDNPNLSLEAQSAAEAWLAANGFDGDIATPPHTWSSRGNAQEAHEAIRPTDFNVDAIKIDDEKNFAKLQALYQMIRDRALASRMSCAEFDTQQAVLQGNISSTVCEFIARGSIRRYAGWQRLVEDDQTSEKESESDSDDTGNRALPQLKPGDVLQVDSGKVAACKTKPPARYTEASLIRELESKGIGRPSTYAAIIGGLLKRDYIRSMSRKLHATELGISLYEVVSVCSFSGTSYTALIEDRLDRILERRDGFLQVVSSVNDQLDNEITQLTGLKKTVPVEPGPPKAKTCTKKSSSHRTVNSQLAGTKSPSKNSSLAAEAENDVLEGNRCPKCSSGAIILKTIKSGKNIGKTVLACNQYQCTFFKWASNA